MTYTFGSTAIDLDARPVIMGVLNVTPDSFSDGGLHATIDDAISHAASMIEEGTDMIDVGGESTRPGAAPVSLDEELRRTAPVIEALTRRFPQIPISIDTYKSEVAAHALDAGATIVNDISGGVFDPKMFPLCGARHASMVLMHIQGTPRTMQANPEYTDVVAEVRAFLAAQVDHARAAGITQIMIDVGIGFGKTLEHNLTLLRNLPAFQSIGCPMLLGVSRKSFIGALLGGVPVQDRLMGTAGAVVAGVLGGAQILRVHDVRAMREAATVAFALRP